MCETRRETGQCSVWRERIQTERWLRWENASLGEIPIAQRQEVLACGVFRVNSHRWRSDTFVASGPNEDEIVLNSTCLRDMSLTSEPAGEWSK
jgi:hypothetical protein